MFVMLWLDGRGLRLMFIHESLNEVGPEMSVVLLSDLLSCGKSWCVSEVESVHCGVKDPMKR